MGARPAQGLGAGEGAWGARRDPGRRRSGSVAGGANREVKDFRFQKALVDCVFGGQKIGVSFVDGAN